MKVCPRCNRTYADENLNFCLNDGELLQQFGDDAPPTIMMDSSRTTNPNNNWQQYEAPPNSPPAAWQQATPMQNQKFGTQVFTAADKTLPTISLVLGILGFLLVCCYGGFPVGLAAVITGYLGMKNADSDPSRYGGRGLAVGGMILGAVALVSSIVFILIAIIAS